MKASKHGSGRREPSFPLQREITCILLLGVAGFLVLSLVSYSPVTDPGFFHRISPKPTTVKNLGGPIGSYTASLLKETFGIAGYLVPAGFSLVAALVMLRISMERALWRVPAGILLLLGTSVLLALLFPERDSRQAGGLAGYFLSNRVLLPYLHAGGAYLAVLVAVLVSGMTLFQFSFFRLLKGASRAARWTFLRGRGMIASLPAFMRSLGKGVTTLFVRSSTLSMRLMMSLKRAIEQRRRKDEGCPVAERCLPDETDSRPVIVDHSFVPERGISEPHCETLPVSGPSVTPFPEERGELEESDGPRRKKTPRARPVQTSFPFVDTSGISYRVPPLDLLDDPDSTHVSVDHKDLLDNARVMEQKLRDFGVEGKVTEVHPGPIITLFEYEPAAGVKVNRIVTLSDDLAMALKAVSVRIVAPIPGKSVVGIEVPNPVRQKVFLKEILASEVFQASAAKLPLALGKDIAGRPVTTDLSRMPHLLIAGATGTGKSVCLHTLILSLLFRFSPQEIKFLMIDPKMLELTSYQGIPHLLHPVITDARRASDVLEWAVERMEQRYQLLSEKGVRNIENYNSRYGKGEFSASSEHTPAPLAEHAEAEMPDIDGSYLMPEQGPLPYIVIVIDEMADLMIISGRQVEEAITRLAQMARAAGIHLLLATQRPSVDVLTGIIKANLPTRISFQVSSRIDSRTILDTIGAEKLLGQGDMLFLPPGTSKVRRIHGAFVHEVEIERIVEFLKRYGKPRYEKIPFHTKKPKEEPEFEQDEKYDEAVQLVAETRQASISMIQRRLRVGYNRAARMIERMEQEGIVGPQEGIKPREVLVQKT